ncbi:helix-turn-helix domain-containing protein [Microbulbifer thermotolerans]|uniref:helix-turn-helix domain-containing protein n=1 Tax=Microbulbifer thermotolerans TaxID=252514 RepID=UPI003969E805
MTAFKLWRERMGWTQREAARALGVTLATYQSWENERRWKDGATLTPPRTALLAAAALEADIAQISIDSIIESRIIKPSLD